MKVFRIKSDVNSYRWLMPDVMDSEILTFTMFDCTRRFSTWSPPTLFVYDKSAKEGDFAYYTSGAVVIGPGSIDKVKAFFEKAGELLPLWCEDNCYTLLNVTVCYDALNHDKTEWHLTEHGDRISLRKIYFERRKLEAFESSIFKIPETCNGSVLTWEIDGNPKKEFKACVEANGLTGLIFEELWDSEIL